MRRLRFKGLIVCVKDSHRYILTTYDRRVAYLMSKPQERIFHVVGVALATPVTVSSLIAQAFQQIDAELARLIARAQLVSTES